jgi:hypothetical protein
MGFNVVYTEGLLWGVAVIVETDEGGDGVARVVAEDEGEEQ